MRIALAATCLLVVASTAEIPFAPEEGLTLTKTFESGMVMTLDDVEMTVQGESQDVGDLPDLTIRSKETIVFADTYGTVEDGRPLRLERSFETLEVKRSQATPDGDVEMEEDSELEGLSVVFAWDADEEEYAVSWADEDDAGDDELLDGLVEDADLRCLLPTGDVEEGDTWEVDIAALHAMQTPGGYLSFLDQDGNSSRDEIDEEIDENIDGEVTCELAGIREEDGRRIAEITFTAEMESEGDMEDEVELDEGPTLHQGRTVEVSGEYEGTLLWDLAGGHALSLELTGELDIVVTETSEFPIDMENVIELEQVMSFTGETSFSVSFE